MKLTPITDYMLINLELVCSIWRCNQDLVIETSGGSQFIVDRKYEELVKERLAISI